MHKSIAAMALLLIPSVGAVQAESVSGLDIEYIYDLSDPTYFDFKAKGTNHRCGSNLYRVWSNDAEVVKRKLSLVMLAFASASTLTLNAEGCWGSRRVVGWLRVVNP